MTHRVHAMLWASVVSSAAIPVAAQAPSVRVRAESRIELRTERTATGVNVVGVLRDDLGTPLAGRPMRMGLVSAEGDPIDRESIATQRDGTFGWSLTLGPGTYRLSAEFAGDDVHRGVPVQREIDLRRAEVRLFVRLESSDVDLDQASLEIFVTARSSVGGEGLQVDLLDELDRPLGRGVSDAGGDVALVVPTSALGPPGSGRIRASTRGDATRAAAQTEIPIVRFRATRLTLAAESPSAHPGEAVALTGELADRRGPIRDRAIGIFAGDHHRGTVLTDESGAFRFEVAPTRDDGTMLALQARFESDSPGRPSASSEVVVLRILGGAPVGWVWSLLPASLCLLVLVLVRLRSVRSRVPEARKAPALAGLVLERPRARVTSSLEVSGVVRNHRDGRPLHATVRITGHTERVFETDDQGRFHFELAAGRYQLRFERVGFAPLTHPLLLPHRGEWSEVQVRMESWRARALSVFERVVVSAMPRARWERMTVREAAESHPTAGARELGSEVELLVYGPLEPAPVEVASVEARAEEILASGPPPG